MAVQMGEHGKGHREMPQVVRAWNPGAEMTREGGLPQVCKLLEHPGSRGLASPMLQRHRSRVLA